jgi:hypothetical protein
MRLHFFGPISVFSKGKIIYKIANEKQPAVNRRSTQSTQPQNQITAHNHP